MPALPSMPPLPPFIAKEKREELVEKGLSFWIEQIAERTGTDPKGNPKEELVYTIFCPELFDGPGAVSLFRTSYRDHQAALIRPLLASGTVGPCRLVKAGPAGQEYFSIEPVEEAAP